MTGGAEPYRRSLAEHHFSKKSLTMKKILFLALLLSVSAIAGVNAADKKDKKKQKAPVAQPLVLAGERDSISYAAGMAATEGLLPYLRQQYGVDSASVKYFVEALKESLGKTNDPIMKARNAGFAIASMVQERMIPQLSQTFEGTKDSLKQETFYKGFLAAIEGDTTVYTTSKAGEYFAQNRARVEEGKNAAWKQENVAWLEANKQKEGVKTTSSGLQYKVLTQGQGEVAGATDQVTVKYEGKTIDGNVFDSSYKRNPQTTSFRPNQVIKGWTEALTMMPVGSKWELYIPANLAYNERQAGSIKPFSTLIFTVEVVSVQREKTAEKAPEASSAKPATTAKAAKAKPVKRKIGKRK